MVSKYCNCCWAKSNRRCICPPEKRAETCKKAEITYHTKRLCKSKELKGLLDYISYISMRIAYLKMYGGDSNEYKFYYVLRKRIKQWGKDHLIFYKYLKGEITNEQAIALYGVSGRTWARIAMHQRKQLIAFIEENEKILDEKYPHIRTEEQDDETEERT